MKLFASEPGNDLDLVRACNPISPRMVSTQVGSPEAQRLRSEIIRGYRTATSREPAPRLVRRARPMLLIGSALCLGVGAAVAATLAFNQDDVARYLPQGHSVFVGTSPVCETIRPMVEYRCTLSSRPVNPLVGGDYTNTVVQTVDDEKRINGGCRATSADGLAWTCFIGQEAVTEGILEESIVGAMQSGPAHG